MEHIFSDKINNIKLGQFDINKGILIPKKNATARFGKYYKEPS